MRAFQSVQTKQQALREQKWVLVNIQVFVLFVFFFVLNKKLQITHILKSNQDVKEFASSLLNRDTWSDKALQQLISQSFVMWQVSPGQLLTGSVTFNKTKV